MADETKLDERIRQRAFKIWVEDGRPEGKEREHWELAKFAISQEDAMPTMLKVPEVAAPEPIEAVENLGEFPTLTDQGEEKSYPTRK